MTLLLQDTLVISPKTKQQVDKNTADIAELQEKSAIAYHFKGSKPTFNDLPTTGNEVGDVWDVQDTGVNYGWTGTEWDELGPLADLEPYLTKEEADVLLASKQDTLTAGDGIVIENNVISTTVELNLSALDDVTITDPTDGQILTYNTIDGVWENTTSTALTNVATGAEGALAIGDSSTGSGRGSTAIGAGSSATETYSVAVGHNAKANGGLIAIGNEATASSINAMAFGFGAKATGNGSLVVGQSTASGEGAIAIGSSNKAGGSNSISIGGSISNTSGQYSLRIGYNARQVSTYDLTGNYGIGIGYNAYTTNQYGTAIGSNANVKADYGIQLGRGSNSDANTFKVGLSDTLNVELLSADGTIPADRLAEIMIVSNTAPTTSTVGALGDLYKDTSTGTIYKCTAVDSSTPSYTWKEFGSSGETQAYITKSWTLTLPLVNWIENKQTFTIQGLTADSSVDLNPVVPTTREEMIKLSNAGLFISALGENSVTIECMNLPTEDLTVKLKREMTTNLILEEINIQLTEINGV